MSDETTIVSKVLVHECNDDALAFLKSICTNHNLVGLKVSTGDNSIGIKDASNEIDDVLKSNVDLGAIFLAEDIDQNGISGIDLCVNIRKARPELPIYLRRRNATSDEDLPEEVNHAVTGCYNTNNSKTLDDLKDAYI